MNSESVFSNISKASISSFIPETSDRFKHIMGVIKLAEEIDAVLLLNGDLVLAAVYHDIGCSEKLFFTGFHPVDGALKAIYDGMVPNVVNTIICHPGARGEAELKDCALLSFYTNANENPMLARLLTYCDTHVNSTGERTSLDERMSGIFKRCDSTHIVYKNMQNNYAYFKKIEGDVEKLLLH